MGKSAANKTIKYSANIFNTCGYICQNDAGNVHSAMGLLLELR